VEDSTESLDTDIQGQSAPEGDAGNSEDPGASEGHSAEESANEDSGLDSFEKRYNDLRPEFDRKSQRLSEIERSLNAYGGVDRAAAALQYMTTDPEFVKLINKKQGISSDDPPEEELDDDMKQAKETILKWTQEAMKEELGKYNAGIAPVLDDYRTQQAQSTLSEMDVKHPGWRDYTEDMGKLLGELSPDIKKIDLKLVEGLFFNALSRSGKMDAWLDSKMKTKLAEKKGKSVEKPDATVNGTVPKAKTMVEALNRALKQHNVSF